MSTKPKKTREQRIASEKRRLNRIFREADKQVREVAKSLIENAAFMAVMCTDLQDEIAEKGVTVEYQNGANQWGTKKSPEVETYNSMIKNLAGVIGTLSRLVPGGTDEADELLEFLAEKRQRRGGGTA